MSKEERRERTSREIVSQRQKKKRNLKPTSAAILAIIVGVAVLLIKDEYFYEKELIFKVIDLHGICRLPNHTINTYKQLASLQSICLPRKRKAIAG